MNRNHLVPRTVLDKNGKQTTVYVRPEDAAGFDPAVTAPPPSAFDSNATTVRTVEATYDLPSGYAVVGRDVAGDYAVDLVTYDGFGASIFIEDDRDEPRLVYADASLGEILDEEGGLREIVRHPSGTILVEADATYGHLNRDLMTVEQFADLPPDSFWFLDDDRDYRRARYHVSQLLRDYAATESGEELIVNHARTVEPERDPRYPNHGLDAAESAG